MAYADYAFYAATYLGDTLTEDNAPKWLSRASDMLDVITRKRTALTMPTDAYGRCAVAKACCAIAEALHDADALRRASAAQLQADGTVRGPVASISSGRESISFASAGGSATRYAAAANDPDELAALSLAAAIPYLADVTDSAGVNLLYAGRPGRRYHRV